MPAKQYKKAQLFLISLFIFFDGFTQGLGGSNPNELIPQFGEPKTFTGNNFNSNVSLLSGTYNASYSLGKVETPGGLSYELKIGYSSDKVLGGTEPIAKGIPYGEGWNLQIPKITPYSYSNKTYSDSYIAGLINSSSPGTHNDKHVQPITYGPKEGDIYVLGVHISIPGKLNCKAVYKYTDATGQEIFIPQVFEKYVKIRKIGDNWEITFDDGTEYLFNLSQVTYRRASNERGTLKYNGTSTDLLGGQFIPKKEYLGWYCTRIYNPNLPKQRIALIYDRYGDFNFFKEYTEQEGISAIFRSPNFTGAPYSYGSLTSYRDILLKEIVAFTPSGNGDRLVLDYQTIARGTNGLDISSPEVSRKDSLYSYKTVYSPSNYSSWKRYLHAAHDRVQSAHAISLDNSTSYNFSNQIGARNPYRILNRSMLFGTKYFRESIGSNTSNVAFDHGYLESHRLSSVSQKVPGDIYEIKGNITKNSDQIGFCNFDINVVTGVPSSAGLGYIDEINYNFNGYGEACESIYSTFSSGIKWNTKGQNHPYHPSTSINFSNLFQMPNLPNNYSGYLVQLGPANSDHAYNINYANMFKSGATTHNNGRAFRAYDNELYGYFGTPSLRHNLLAYYEDIPARFGLGMPWYILKGTYKYMGANDDTESSLNYHFWFKNNSDPNFGSSNNSPTLAGPGTLLNNFEIIRYSKNPYMLKSIKKYKVTNETNIAHTDNLILTSQVNLDYELKDTVVRENKHYNNLETFSQLNGLFQTTYLLKSISHIPVDPTATATNIVSNDITYRFKYTSEYTPPKYESSLGLITTNISLLEKTISPTGKETKIEYYPIVKDSCLSGYKTLASLQNATGAYSTHLGTRNHTVQVNALVKRIKIKKGNTLEEVKKYDYSWSNLLVIPQFDFGAIPIASEKYAFKSGVGLGFEKTTVTTESADDNQNYVEYIHDNGSTDYFLSGKLKSEKYYDENHNLMREIIYDYESKIAYKNGFQRAADDYGSWDFDYIDYYFQRFKSSNLSDFVANNSAGSVGFSVRDMYYTRALNQASMNLYNSYFLKLNRKTEKLIDPNACVSEKPLSYRPGGTVINVSNDNDQTSFINEVSEDLYEFIDIIDSEESYSSAIEEVEIEQLSDEVLLAFLNKFSYKDDNDFDEVLNPQDRLSDSIYKLLITDETLRSNAVFRNYESEKDNQMTEFILDILIDYESSFTESFLSGRLLKEIQLSDSLLLKIVDNSQNFSQSFLESILLHQQGLTSQVRKKLFDNSTELSIGRIKNILLAHDPFPSDTVINLLLTNYASSNPSDVMDVLHSSPTAFSQIVMDSVNSYLSSFNQSDIDQLNYLQENSPSLLANCNGNTSTEPLIIETITDYEYYDANFSGVSYSKGYKELFYSPHKDSIYLKYEPSWQLYSERTYSPSYPQAFNETRYYYYYDLRNRYDRYMSEYHPDSSNLGSIVNPTTDTTWYANGGDFSAKIIHQTDTVKLPFPDGLNRSLKHEIRTIPYQIKRIFKNSENNKASEQSEYFEYNSKWGNGTPINLFDDIEVIEFAGNQSNCPTDTCQVKWPVPYTNIIDDRTGNVMEVLGLSSYHGLTARVYKDIYSGNFFVVYKDWPCTFGADTVLVHTQSNKSEIPNVPEDQITYWNLNDAMLLANAYVQVDQNLSSEFNQLFTSGQHHYLFGKSRIANFDSIAPYVAKRFSDGTVWAQYDDHFPMVFPYEVMNTINIKQRNKFTLPTLFEDEKGLLTRLEYDPTVLIRYRDTVCDRWDGEKMDYGSMQKPVKKVVYPSLHDSLITTYEYYQDLSLKSITDPLGNVKSLSYDDFGRQREMRLNGTLINRYNYSLWDGDLNLNFLERTSQNYFETIHFPNDSNESAIVRRSYTDPVGRIYMTAESELENGVNSDSAAIAFYSGRTDYDSRNRKVKSFKPFSYQYNDKQILPDLRVRSNDLIAYPDTSVKTVYENDWQGRLSAIAQAGENTTTGNHSSYSYQFMNSYCLSCDLDLSNYELGLIMPQGADSTYVFQKSTSIDEDGKQTDVYTNVLGQTIATKNQLNSGGKIVTIMTYNNQGKPSIVINPKNQKSEYHHNLMGWLYKKETVDGGVSKYMYNKSGQVTYMQDEKNMAGKYHNTDQVNKPTINVNVYDTLGRLTSTGESFVSNYIGSSLTALSPLTYENTTIGNGITRDINNPYYNASMSDASTYDWLNTITVWDSTVNHQTSAVSWDTVKVNVKDFVDPQAYRKKWHYGDSTARLVNIQGIIPTLTSANSTTNRKARLHYVMQFDQEDMAPNRGSDSLREITIYNYDQKGNVTKLIKHFKPNGIGVGGIGKVSIQEFKDYNNDGVYKTHNVKIGTAPHIDLQYYRVLDSKNRTLELYVNHANDKQNGNLTASFDYDWAFGRIKKKKTYYKHGTLYELDSVFYNYDIRDRVTSINSEWLDYNLYYDGSQASYNGHTPNGDLNYNGNINGIKADYKLNQAINYSGGNYFDNPSVYNYSYDALNRLTNADAAIGDFLVGTNPTHDSYKYGDASFSYDFAGNILSISRYTDVNATNQNLQMTYSGHTNKLTEVNDDVLTYDVVGNLISDERRGLTQTKYLSNNLPSRMYFSTAYHYDYQYDHMNKRVYKRSSEAIESVPWYGPEKSWYYLRDLKGNAIAIYDELNINWEFYAYEGERIARIIPKSVRQPQGHTGANPSGTELDFVDFYRYDHLGNTRVVYRAQWNTQYNQFEKKLESAIDYFPYGKVHRSYVPATGYERYLTTQHERDHESYSDTDGSGLDNRGARLYDSDIARFLSLDPAAAEYPSLSDYVYVAGNPVIFVDPDGKRLDHYFSRSGVYLGSDGVGNNVRIHNTATSSSVFQKSLRTNGIFGTRANSELVRVMGDNGLGNQIYKGSLGTKGENSHSIILDAKTATVYTSKDNAIGSAKGDNVSLKPVDINGKFSHKIRAGDAQSKVVIGNIHGHQTSTKGVSMFGDITIDKETDQGTANKHNISVYAGDKNGVTKVTSSGVKSVVKDQNLMQDALNDYIDNQ